MARLFIQKEDGNEVAVDEVVPGLRFLKLTHKPSPIVNNWATVNGRDGEHQYGDYTYGPSTTTADFFFKGNDYPDFRLAVDKVGSLFRSRKPLRIRDSTQPGLIQYGVIQDYDMVALNFIDSQLSIPFDIPSGMRQSLVRSDDDWNSALELGMNFPDDYVPTYTFNSGNFSVLNPSDIDISPFEQGHDLRITMKVDGHPMLTNTTTGRSFSYHGNLTSADTLVLNGTDASVNGVPVKPTDTDWGDINLKANSFNSFTVTGCTVNKITFSFPFLYF